MKSESTTYYYFKIKENSPLFNYTTSDKSYNKKYAHADLFTCLANKETLMKNYEQISKELYILERLL